MKSVALIWILVSLLYIGMIVQGVMAENSGQVGGYICALILAASLAFRDRHE